MLFNTRHSQNNLQENIDFLHACHEFSIVSEHKEIKVKKNNRRSTSKMYSRHMIYQ